MKTTTTNLLLILSLFLSFNFTFGQVSESFSNIPTNSIATYQLRDWTGDDGFAWQADNARVDQTMFGKAITIRGDNGYLKNNGGSIPNGCGTLEFAYARVFAGNSTIQVWINGTQIGTNITVSSTSPTLYSNVLNIAGNIDIEIRNITLGRRVKIDNLAWSAFPPLPTITVSPTTLTGFTYVEGNGPSTEQSFGIGGINLTNNITISSGSNFEISTTSGAGYALAVTLVHSGGVVNPTTIYVRQKAGLLAFNSPFSENINCNSPGAATKTVMVDGTVTLAPPCNIFASNVTLGSQNFEVLPPLFNLPYASTNTSFSSGLGLFPLAFKFVSPLRGIEVNNANGEIIFDVIDASILANIEFTIRLASFSGTPGNGSDVADRVRISISEDNGVTYSRELTVSGRSNARWSFGGGTGIASSSYDGDDIPAQYQPAAGGLRTTDGYSTLRVSNLPSSPQLRIKIDILNNNNNEFWVLDDATFIADVIESTAWNGTNWTFFVPPTPTVKAIINGDYDMTSPLLPSITACECRVNTGNTLTITAGDYLEVGNDIINDGNIFVRHEGSIVQYNDDATVTGNNFGIEKTTTPYLMYDYTYWSSPIENADLGTVFSTNPANRIYDFTTANFDDSNGDTFDDNNDDWNVASGLMTPAKGYIAMGEGAIFPVPGTLPTTSSQQSVGFLGKINNGVITIPVTLDANPGDAFNNQNLIGNPYPSAIDATKFLAANLNLSGTLYFWTHNTQISSSTTGPDTYNFTNNDYMTYTAGLGFVAGSCSGCVVPVDDLIASGQGFFADVNLAGTVKFNNAMRVATGNDNFFRATTIERDRIWINMTNEDGLFRQILIGFADDATNGHDRDYDGKRIDSGNNFDFYSLMGNQRYAIQGFPTITNQKIVPIGIEAPLTGSLKISIDRFEADLENINVYLKDNLLNTIYDLKIADYNFDINQEGEFNNRFELIFSRNALATNNNEILSNDKLIVSNLNDEIYFKMINGSTISKIQAFDIIGKLILQANPNTSAFSTKTNIDNGTILFIKVQLENGQILTKKLIKQ